MSMNGCPAPDFSDFFSFNDLSVPEPIPSGTAVPPESALTSIIKSDSSTPVPISPASERPIVTFHFSSH